MAELDQVLNMNVVPEVVRPLTDTELEAMITSGNIFDSLPSSPEVNKEDRLNPLNGPTCNEQLKNSQSPECQPEAAPDNGTQTTETVHDLDSDIYGDEDGTLRVFTPLTTLNGSSFWASPRITGGGMQEHHVPLPEILDYRLYEQLEKSQDNSSKGNGLILPEKTLSAVCGDPKSNESSSESPFGASSANIISSSEPDRPSAPEILRNQPSCMKQNDITKLPSSSNAEPLVGAEMFIEASATAGNELAVNSTPGSVVHPTQSLGNQEIPDQQVKSGCSNAVRRKRKQKMETKIELSKVSRVSKDVSVCRKTRESSKNKLEAKKSRENKNEEIDTLRRYHRLLRTELPKLQNELSHQSGLLIEHLSHDHSAAEATETIGSRIAEDLRRLCSSHIEIVQDDVLSCTETEVFRVLRGAMSLISKRLGKSRGRKEANVAQTEHAKHSREYRERQSKMVQEMKADIEIWSREYPDLLEKKRDLKERMMAVSISHFIRSPLYSEWIEQTAAKAEATQVQKIKIPSWMFQHRQLVDDPPDSSAIPATCPYSYRDGEGAIKIGFNIW